MGTAHQLREPGFELFDERTFRGNPARLDTFRQILLLVTIKYWAINRYHERLFKLELYRQHCREPSLVRIAGIRSLLDLHHIEIFQDLEPMASRDQQNHVSRTEHAAGLILQLR